MTSTINSLFLLFISINHASINHCGKKTGTFIKTFEVHGDTAALIKLRTNLSNEFSSDFNTLSAALKFFGGVFDMTNEILQPYGVQLRADLSRLRLESYNVMYNQADCDNTEVASYRTSVIQMNMPPGNHLNLYYCKKGYKSKTIVHKQCDVLIGITLYDIRELAHELKNELIRAISKDRYENDGVVTSSFNSELCSQARSCMKYEFGLKSIRHLGAENYITGQRFQKKEHDMYDDVSDGQGGDPELYATQDYSNDDELYEDHEKQTKGIGEIMGKLPF